MKARYTLKRTALYTSKSRLDVFGVTDTKRTGEYRIVQCDNIDGFLSALKMAIALESLPAVAERSARAVRLKTPKCCFLTCVCRTRTCRASLCCDVCSPRSRCRIYQICMCEVNTGRVFTLTRGNNIVPTCTINNEHNRATLTLNIMTSSLVRQ